ncbi:MAG: DUF4126 domain-containing protein [Acidobacteriota bacterium]|nr:DUF4126 domain-containing protein [Acidobacteriota bacterium]
MEVVGSVLIGLGLAAACGFRIFVPLLIASLASRFGHLPLSHGFGWLASSPALIAFAVATVVEIGAYYIPWVDNLLDAIATPTAILAGMMLTAGTLVDMGPLLRWTLAVVAGGGTAALFQGLTTTARQVSSLTTGGLGNPVLATAEAGGSALLSVLAIMVPLVAAVLVGLLLYYAVRKLIWRRPVARPT